MTYQHKILFGTTIITCLLALAIAFALPSGVNTITTCKNISFQEQETIWSTCTRTRTEQVCTDVPLNLSCHQEQETETYTCANGTTTVEKTNTICETTGFIINDAIKLNTNTYHCSVIDEGKVYVTCDSIYDGNGDGICTSGESRVQFGIVGNTVQRAIRNSQDKWTETDDSFFLGEASAEVLS